MDFRTAAARGCRGAVRLVALIAALLCLAAPAPAQFFEKDGWPGEGAPVFASKKDELTVYQHTTKLSPPVTVHVRKGWKIIYDRSKIVTKQSVMLKALRDLSDLTCEDGGVSIKAGDNVEYLQRSSEGYGTVRVKTSICEVFLQREGDFEGLEQTPVTEWWIRMVGGDGTPFGWLLVDEEELEFLPRRF